jgi:O-antigen/teichoic acid export membrane protein
MLLSQGLGAEKFGIYSLALNLVSILVAAGSLGASSGVVAAFGRFSGSSKSVVQLSVYATLIIGLLVTLLAIVTLHFEPKINGTAMGLAFIIASAMAAAAGIVAVIPLGLQSFGVYSYCTAFPAVIVAVAALHGYFATAMKSAEFYLFVWAAAQGSAVLIVLIAIRKNFTHWIRFRQVREMVDLGFMKYMCWAWLGSLVTLLNYRVGLLFVSGVSGANMAAVGQFALAASLMEALWFISNAVGTVLVATVVNNLSNPRENEEVTERSARLVFSVTFIAALSLASAFFVAGRIVLSKEYAEIYKIMILLAPGVALWSAARIVANYFAGVGDTFTNLLITIVVLILNVVLCYALGAGFGMLGVATAVGIAYAAFGLLTCAAYIFKTQSSVSDVLFVRWSDLLWAAGRAR